MEINFHLSQGCNKSVMARYFAKLLRLFRRRADFIRDSAILVAFMISALVVAYTYSFYSFGAETKQQAKVIDLDEALTLAGLLCLGLLVLCGRLLMSQRREVRLRARSEQHARSLANQDALTGLPNRRQFDRELKASIAAPPRIGGAHAVLLIDLNGFKRVNDVYGHSAGDEALINVGRRLQHAVRAGDLVVRLGGDEFAILARQLTGPEEATTIAMRVIKEFEPPIIVGSVHHQIGVGLGISLFPADGDDEREIMRKADIALYRAKAEPGSASRFFETGMDARIRERDILERELRKAIQTDTIQAYYQPQMDLNTNKVIGFEALARWTHPTLGVIPPDRFITVAESCGLISTLTDQLLRQAADVARQWPENITLSFNISPVQLKDPGLATRVLTILSEKGLSPRRLEIEITESALVYDLEGAQRVLGALREAGVRIALDDFGTGYSSLYHLRNFQIDKIKIDRSFIENMEFEPKTAALVHGLLGLGRGLGLTVTAEGVELPEQAAALRREGCDQAQGYLYARAVSSKEATEFLALNEAGSHTLGAVVA